MTKDINAKQFFEEFTTLVYREPKIIEDYWGNYKVFTGRIIPIINSIIRESGCCVSNEYFRIDASGWNSRYKDISQEAKKIKMNPHLWDLMIAVEHENDKRDWADEVIKLLHIRCPLKVVIGYNDFENRTSKGDVDTVNTDEGKLAVVAHWMKETYAMKSLYAAKDSRVTEDLLIILGNAGKNPDKNNPAKSFDYRGYLYNYQTGAFERI